MRVVVAMLGIFLGGVAASCDAPGMAREGFAIAGEIRAGHRSAAEIAGDADLALARRRELGREPVVAWGEVLDAALDSGVLDARRRARVFAEAVAVEWHGKVQDGRSIRGEVDSDHGSGAEGGPWGGSILFVFKPCVGVSSEIDYDGEILEASVDGVRAALLPRETRVRTANATNAGPLLTFQSIRLPPSVEGRTVIVRWRVRIFSAATTSSLAPDWEETRAIGLPEGRVTFEGHCVRAVEGER